MVRISRDKAAPVQRPGRRLPQKEPPTGLTQSAGRAKPRTAAGRRSGRPHGIRPSSGRRAPEQGGPQAEPRTRGPGRQCDGSRKWDQRPAIHHHDGGGSDHQLVILKLQLFGWRFQLALADRIRPREHIGKQQSRSGTHREHARDDETAAAAQAGCRASAADSPSHDQRYPGRIAAARPRNRNRTRFPPPYSTRPSALAATADRIARRTGFSRHRSPARAGHRLGSRSIAPPPSIRCRGFSSSPLALRGRSW